MTGRDPERIADTLRRVGEGSMMLKALCQRCHNAYDAPMRRRGIMERQRETAAVGDLFTD